MLPQQGRRRKSFHGGDIAGAPYHHIRFLSLIGASPIPYANALRAVQDGLIHGQILQVRLFIRNNHIDIICTAQAVIHHR